MKFYWLAFFTLFLNSCFMFKISDKKAIKEFKKAGIPLQLNTFKINDRDIHYAQTGNDSLPLIFFVHGSPGSWSAFKAFLKDPALLKNFSMLSIDRPGFGQSNFGASLNLTEQSNIISPLLQKLKMNRPVFLVGHSYGGPLICRLAIENPTLVSGLVILAGAQDPDAEKPEKWRPILFNSFLNAFVPGAFKPSNEELWHLKKDLQYLKPELFKITCPVFLLHGTKDKLVPFSNMAFTKNMLTQSTKINSIAFEGEKHSLPWKRFKEIRDLLLALSE